MTDTTAPSFGIATAPQQVGYHDVLRVWREADTIPRDRARLAVRSPACRSPATRTARSSKAGRCCQPSPRRPSGCASGLLVTSNRFRPPGACWPRSPRPSTSSPAGGSTSASARARGPASRGPGASTTPTACPTTTPPTRSAASAEACTVIRRLWTEDEPFDFDGSYVQLTGAYCNPKPVQRPYPPIMIGGRPPPTLRVVAEHADMWNIPGGDIDGLVRRSAVLDRFCAEIGRDPAAITRSIILPVSYDHPGGTRDAIAAAVDAGFRHVVLTLPAPYPDSVARWVADEIIGKSAN